MTPHLLALLSAMSLSLANITVRQGLKYSTPITATLISLIAHTLFLWIVLLFQAGIPAVEPMAVLAITITAVLQPVMRLCHYIGIEKVGASRAVTLRNTFPILSVIIGIVILHEKINTLGAIGAVLTVLGIVLTTWKLEGRLVNFRKWHLIFPLITALVTGITHPLRRFALTISNEPLFFTALVGPISLVSFLAYLASPISNEKPVWDKKALWPFIMGGIFETSGVLLMLLAFASGPVVLVSPIVATTPIWTLLFAAIFLRDLERLGVATTIGTLSVVIGVIVLSLAD